MRRTLAVALVLCLIAVGLTACGSGGTEEEAGKGEKLTAQRAAEALAISDWAYVMRAGSVAVSQSAAELRERDDIGQMLLGATI